MPNPVDKIIHDGSKFIALTQYGKIYTSTDGITWTPQTDFPSNTGLDKHVVRSIAYNGTRYVAVGNFYNVSTYATSPLLYYSTTKLVVKQMRTAKKMSQRDFKF
jgi:hypothetical protein